MESFDSLYKKLMRYCAYQERSESEVRLKLRTLGAPAALGESVLKKLREENFVNEERFARAYVRGKFRINAWGRLKIRNGLRAKGVDEKLISRALSEEIDEKQYQEAMRKVVAGKGLKTAFSRGFEVNRNFGNAISSLYSSGEEE
ncbi:MAG: RecX family transcriptional regulator [Bacteroidales bacterium]|nr:RecX family transcriptional regulator [Bacteroidales bacterium]